MHTLTELRALLKQYRLAPRRQLGQHFLIDPSLVLRLIDLMELSASDEVVEVGPGFGALTLAMAERVRHVVAVEHDRVLAHALQQRLGPDTNVTVVHGDILEFALPARSRVVGAIPYSITSPLLEHLMRQKPRLQDAWLIVQREVAERIVARPATPAYSRLSCFAQYHFEAVRRLRIASRAFFPQPQVASVLLQLVTRGHPAVTVEDEERFFNIIKAAFAHRRKTLLNNVLPLAGGGGRRQALEAHLRSRGFNPMRRGETLSLEEFARLAAVLQSFV